MDSIWKEQWPFVSEFLKNSPILVLENVCGNKERLFF